MAVDWDEHFDAIYEAQGVPALLTCPPDGGDFDLTVIDHTTGIEVGGEAGGIVVHSIKPAADVRNSELTAKTIARENLDGARLTLDGTEWTVANHALRFKEVRLILTARDA